MAKLITSTQKYMDYEKVLGERLIPTYEELKSGLLRLIDEGKISREDAARVLPELRESEDERIRKWLADYFSSIKKTVWIHRDISCEQILEWLEKQKEPKQTDLPAGFYYIDLNGNRYYSKEFRYGDMKLKVGEQKPVESISQLTVQGKGVYKICPRCKERMVRDDSKVYTSMPPQYGYVCPKCGEMEFDTVMYDNPEMVVQKPQWSEEDKSILEALIYDIERLPMQGVLTHRPCDSYIKFLKSIRPGWKPTEEQMNELWSAISYIELPGSNYLGGPELLKSLYERLKNL